MESLLIANQIKHLEEQVSSIQQSILLLKDLLITTSNDTTSNDTTSNDTTSNDTTSNDTTKTLIESSQPVITRKQYVDDILSMVTNDLNWTFYERKPGYYWFTKKGKCLPFVLENHSCSERVQPAYITTAGWRGNKMCWREFKNWSQQKFNDYKIMIQLLGWEPFGKTTTNRYRLDAYELSMDTIKELFIKFSYFIKT
jgi:hypothetical protein